nr:uncharacterized protein LOC128692250 [Cherax quadricarinatus]
MASVFVLLIVLIFQHPAAGFFFKKLRKCDVSQVPQFSQTTVQLQDIHIVKEALRAPVYKLSAVPLTSTVPYTTSSLFPIRSEISKLQVTETYVITTTVAIPVSRILSTTLSLTTTLVNFATVINTNHYTVFNTVEAKQTLLLATTNYETLLSDAIHTVFQTQTSTVTWTQELTVEMFLTVEDTIPVTSTLYVPEYSTVTSTRTQMITQTVCPLQ